VFVAVHKCWEDEGHVSWTSRQVVTATRHR